MPPKTEKEAPKSKAEKNRPKSKTEKKEEQKAHKAKRNGREMVEKWVLIDNVLLWG
ncbi:hypothetical protein BC936DRAFT_142151 [Jimgerdemannia flammicorona]|uniref:Uncharacterized protein n=1 Tax=Jimgerdemannia flammicorona TaxID=994334 RepID=A0A433A109_9FUNG|nr:hypothetical protein BC936DRAFT_142151 [Jimgerdemannia flammicorona]